MPRVAIAFVCVQSISGRSLRSSRRLTYADIAGLSSWQLSMARNEIYARHGRMFNDPDIRSYFQAQSWYNGYIAPENFDSSVLSDTEVYNIEFIKSYE